MLQLAVDADRCRPGRSIGPGPSLLADLRLADHHLNRARPVADLQPMDLALGPPQNDPARRADGWAMLLPRVVRLGGLAGSTTISLSRRRIAPIGDGHRSGSPRDRCPVRVFYAASRGVRLPMPLRNCQAAETIRSSKASVGCWQTWINGSILRPGGHSSGLGGWVNVNSRGIAERRAVRRSAVAKKDTPWGISTVSTDRKLPRTQPESQSEPLERD